MDKLIFNLQWFSDAGTLVNATGNYVNAYTGDTTDFVTGVTDLSPLNKTFWDTALLDNARDELVHTQLGKKVSLPENKGRTIEFRRWKRLADIGVLTEGVIPTGKKMSIVAITASMTQYGDYVAISDLLDAHGIEDTKLGAVEELGAAAGLTLEKTVRNTLMGSTNIIFADAYNGSSYVSTPSDEAGLQTALGSYTCNVTARVINKAATQLQKGAQMNPTSMPRQRKSLTAKSAGCTACGSSFPTWRRSSRRPARRRPTRHTRPSYLRRTHSPSSIRKAAVWKPSSRTRERLADPWINF